MALHFGGPGVSPINKLGFGNRISLAAGETWTIYPAGPYWIQPGPYTSIQIYDPVLTIWMIIGGAGAGMGEPMYIESDGVNYRLANLTGQAVGATVTTAGTGYTSAPAVTIASGNSIWKPILGQYVTSVTVSNGGSNYTYAPAVLFSSPPAPGVPATGIAVMSAGAVSSVTMVNKGAGYTSPPSVNFINDPREGVNNVTQGSGAAGVSVLAGSGGVNALLCIDPGNTGYSATTTFTISGGGGSSFAASPVFCLTITALASASGGGPFSAASSAVEVSALDAATTTVSAPLNPAVSSGLVKVRKASILAPTTSTSVITSTGQIVYDGGIYTQFSPYPEVISNGSVLATAATVTFTMGGATDTSYIAS
jgi:hypothetical protein